MFYRAFFSSFFLLMANALSAQTAMVIDDEATSVVLSGTSSFHDWEIRKTSKK